MIVLITYDVSTVSEGGNKRLRKVAKICEDYGQRVQNSVFECDIDWTTWRLLKDKLVHLIDRDNDSLRIYYLGKPGKTKIEHIGTKTSFDLQDPLLL